MAKKKHQKKITAQKTSTPPSVRSYKPLLIAGIVAIVLAAAVGLVLRDRPTIVEQKVDVKSPPIVSLTTAEPEVAQKIEKLRKDVVQNLQSSEAWGLLGMNLDAHDFKQQAVLCYQQAAAIDPRNFKWPYYCAVILTELKPVESIEWFERSIKINPSYAPLHVRYGNALFDLGKLEEASTGFQRALDLNSRMIYAVIGLARVELARNNLAKCQSFLETARTMNPNIGEVHGLFSEVYRRQKEFEKAQRSSELANELPKKGVMNDPIYNEIAVEGVSSTWYEARGRAYLQQGKYEDAGRELEAALKVRPEARIHDALGIVYLQQGKLEDAISQHRLALKLLPTEATVWNNLASALFAAGKTKEAIEAAEQGRAVNLNLPYSYVNLGRFYQSIGDRQKAIAIYREGLQKNPGHRRLQENLELLLKH